MRSQVYELDIPAAAAPSFGVALPTRDLSGKLAQLSGTFGAGALTLQGSINGTDFEDLVSGSKTAVEIFEVVEHVGFIRVSKTIDFTLTFALHLIAFDRTEE